MVRLPVTLLMLALSGAKLEEDTSRVFVSLSAAVLVSNIEKK